MTVRQEPLDKEKVDAAWDSAAYWTARHDAAPDTAKDPRFLAWLGAEPENRVVWSQASALWVEAAETLAQDPMIEALSASARARRANRWSPWLSAACLAIAVLGAATLSWRYLTPTFAGPRPASAMSWGGPEFVTAKGDQLETRLADGTRLQLDTDSAIDVSIDNHGRRLRLVRGQAFVDVAPDRRPFSLEAAGQTILDRGTAFATRVDEGVVSIVLLDGKIVAGPSGAAPVHALTPNHRLVLAPGRPAVVEAIDAQSALAWRTGFVEFSGTPLSQAIDELNRYGGRRLVLRDPKLAALRTTGRFKTGDPERFVANAAEVLPIKGVPAGDHLEIIAAERP